MTATTVNPRLQALNPYPFERLRALHADVTANEHLEHIPLSLGEPKHPPPDFVVAALSDAASLARHLATYPATKGSAT